MSEIESWSMRRKRWLDRVFARLAWLSRGRTAFLEEPEPRSIGSYGRGRQLVAGKMLLAGHLFDKPGVSIWDLPVPDAAFADEQHGFTWLDDLAAAGDPEAKARAADWTLEWMRRFGPGNGPGWRPELTGRRLQRLINHSVMISRKWDAPTQKLFLKLLAQHTRFLAWRWKGSREALSRFEALTGLLQASLILEGMDRYTGKAVAALAAECRSQIDEEGGIPSRNPEELLDVFTLLSGCAAALETHRREIGTEHLEAMERIAPTLRALRHADGGLARFHGGGRGAEGRLDLALADSGIRARSPTGRSMGFVRIASGRTTVIQDAAPPPVEAAGFNAHASTLAFEMTSGRRPVIVNCGAGNTFGAEWRRAGRASASHSTLAIEGYSSSRLGARGLVRGQARERLTDAPNDVRLQQSAGHYGISVLTGHNGYQKTHGLTHVRRLDLSADGRSLAGEDTLAALAEGDQRRLERFLERNKMEAVPYAVRFHLHPDVDAEIDLGGSAVSLALKSGEIWVFRHDGHAMLSLDPSVYLERGRLKPRYTRQIVLSARVAEHASQVGWTFSKAQDTPRSIRDLKRDEPEFDV